MKLAYPVFLLFCLHIFINTHAEFMEGFKSRFILGAGSFLLAETIRYGFRVCVTKVFEKVGEKSNEEADKTFKKFFAVDLLHDKPKTSDFIKIFISSIINLDSAISALAFKSPELYLLGVVTDLCRGILLNIPAYISKNEEKYAQLYAFFGAGNSITFFPVDDGSIIYPIADAANQTVKMLLLFGVTKRLMPAQYVDLGATVFSNFVKKYLY